MPRCHRIIDLPADFDDQFDIALAGRSGSDGATIWFERTKAGLVFDVDGMGDALANNHAAAAGSLACCACFKLAARP